MNRQHVRAERAVVGILTVIVLNALVSGFLPAWGLTADVAEALTVLALLAYLQWGR